jgi:magnesium chelatase family protein
MAQYQARLSGPLLDRIDIAIDLPAVTAADLILPAAGEGSAAVAARVAGARRRQSARFEALGLAHLSTNASCPVPVLEEIARPDNAGLALLRDAAEAMRLTARAYHRILKVARTLADLDGEGRVGRLHLAEALSYRSRGEPFVQAA